MNQKNNFGSRIAASAAPARRPGYVRSIFAFGIASLITIFPADSLGQGSPNPGSTGAQSNQNQAIRFHPPPTMAFQDSTIVDPSLPSTTFPDAAVPFDPNVKRANLNVSLDRSLDSSEASALLDGTTSTGMFSNLKDGIGETTSEWMETLQNRSGISDSFESMFGKSDVGRMLGSLALVLGGYFLFVWLMKKISPKKNGHVPSEVVEILGCIPFGPRKNLQLIRLGSKLLLLMNDLEGTRPIGEITDPAEVEYLSSVCLGKHATNPRHAVTSEKTPGNRPEKTQPTSIESPPPESIAALNSNLANVLRKLEGVTHRTSFEA